MDFGFYYRPAVNRIAFYYAPSTGESPCCYDTVVSESRIASYIGIANGELPPKEYYGTWRSFTDTCDWSWQETPPIGVNRTYIGVNVFEGAYEYHGTPSDAVLGRQHVRGADASAVRARGALGAAKLGDQSPANGRGADLPRAP